MAKQKEIGALSKTEDCQQPRTPSPCRCGRDPKPNPVLLDPEERMDIIALVEGNYRPIEELIKV